MSYFWKHVHVLVGAGALLEIGWLLLFSDGCYYIANYYDVSSSLFLLIYTSTCGRFINEHFYCIYLIAFWKVFPNLDFS